MQQRPEKGATMVDRTFALLKVNEMKKGTDPLQNDADNSESYELAFIQILNENAI